MKIHQLRHNILVLAFIFLSASLVWAESPSEPRIQSVKPSVVSTGDKLTISGNFVVTSEIFDENSAHNLEVLIDGEKVENVKNIDIIRPTKNDEEVKEIKILMIPEVPSATKDKGYHRTIMVKVNSQKSNLYQFFQGPKPVITSIDPKGPVSPGGELTLNGNFVEFATGSEKPLVVRIDGKHVKHVIKDPGKKIVVPLILDPPKTTTTANFQRNVVVSIHGRSSKSYPFLQRPNPVITSVEPKELGVSGGELTLTGSFVALAVDSKKKTGDVEVKIDNQPVDFIIKNDGTNIVVPHVPPPSSSADGSHHLRHVVVQVNGKKSNQYPFQQQKAFTPFLTSVTPKRIGTRDTITLKGNFVAKDGDFKASAIVVQIDGKAVDFKVTKPGEELEVVVEDNPASSLKEKRAGEYERSVAVQVNGQQSNVYLINQITWRSIFQFQAFVPMGIFLLGVLLIIAFRRSNPLKSATGQLSLSKIQMAVWTLVFGFAYTVLSAIWWEFLDITEGMFWLMGISSATAVGAKAIVIKNAKVSIEEQKLSYDVWSLGQKVLPKTENKTVEFKDDNIQDIKKILTAGENLGKLTKNSSLESLFSTDKTSFDVVKDFIKKGTIISPSSEETIVKNLQNNFKILISQATKAVPLPSTLLKDWDSANQQYSLSLHRCQIALWTVIVLGLYLVELVSTMHLPNIPDKLLVLMGISGGTYLGFNYPKIAGK